MIIVVIIFSLIYVILLTLILIAYYRDNSDLERRVLELEKQVDSLNIRIKNYDSYIEHELRTAKLRLFFEEIENNTQKECECDMACGRKKGRGGKRK